MSLCPVYAVSSYDRVGGDRVLVGGILRTINSSQLDGPGAEHVRLAARNVTGPPSDVPTSPSASSISSFPSTIWPPLATSPLALPTSASPPSASLSATPAAATIGLPATPGPSTPTESTVNANASVVGLAQAATPAPSTPTESTVNANASVVGLAQAATACAQNFTRPFESTIDDRCTRPSAPTPYATRLAHYPLPRLPAPLIPSPFEDPGSAPMASGSRPFELPPVILPGSRMSLDFDDDDSDSDGQSSAEGPKLDKDSESVDIQLYVDAARGITHCACRIWYYLLSANRSNQPMR
ncbi:hypothetical protein DFP72DRAFT_864920 [Ephemerocybe angulata]|uniref:Uncharacterized protein n=1 Tax=Ephemerocybe angulata TaxID=980116 RepID=A0A8H6H7E5_9AGAR|nr:hypothetical protein DFP72DRAFT_864920 [Tulosesus angulatus]